MTDPKQSEREAFNQFFRDLKDKRNNRHMDEPDFDEAVWQWHLKDRAAAIARAEKAAPILDELDATADLREALDILEELYDDSECRLDHGYCQEHYWLHLGQCPNKRAKALLQRLSNEEGVGDGENL